MNIRAKMKFAAILACVGLSAIAMGACGPSGTSSSSGAGQLAYKLTSEGDAYTLIGIGSHGGGDVVVPEEYKGLPVTGVRYDAFDYYTKLKSITLPDTVTEIGENAFAFCENLESVTFGSGLKKIDTGAFQGCTALTEVVFEDALETISAMAFFECTALESVEFGNSKTLLSEKVFAGCTALEDVDFTGVREVGTYAFQGCTALTEVDLKKAETVKPNAFIDCTGLQTANLGTALKIIGTRAFGSCSKLKSVVVPKTLGALTMDIFSGSQLDAIYFSGSLAECKFKNSITDVALYMYAENDPFANGETNYNDLFWHTIGGKTVHWNENAGSSCVLTASTNTDTYFIKVDGVVENVKFNNAANASVAKTADGISVGKAMLYANPGIHTLTWRNENNTLYVYTLKTMRGDTLDFEDGNNYFVRAMDAVNVDGVVRADVTTGNGRNSLKLTATNGSIYLGLDADYVNAVFADEYVEALQFKIYTPFDLRQKLAWYYVSFKMENGVSKMVGHQIVTNIYYEDMGDYLLITLNRAAYETWKLGNVYMDTDVMQFLFRFTRDLNAGETPTSGGQDTTTEYKWIVPGTFYIDDICAVR